MGMRSVAGVIGLAVVLLAVNTAVAQETKRAGSVARVAIVPVEGEINPGTEEALKRRLKHALDDGAEVILVAVDSPGGRLDSCKNMCDMLMAAVREGHGAVRTVAYVKSQAISAAAIISLSCQEIVMLEGTLIGDAQAVMAIPGKGPQVAPEKAQTFVRSLIRNVAQVNKYPEAVVEAMVDADLEVYKITFPDGSVKYVRKQELEAVERRAAKQEVKTEKKAPTAEAVQSVKPMAPDVLPRKGFKKQLVVAQGKLLTLSSQEAREFGISSATVAGLGEAVAHCGGSLGTATRHEANWSEKMVGFLNSVVVTHLLMIVGMLAIYVAVKTPGLGAPEALAVSCFAILFFSKYLVGLATMLEVVIFIVGFALLAVELFVTPGFGVIGIGGIGCIFVSLILALQRFVLPDPQFPETVRIFTSNLLSVLGSAFVAILLFILLLRYLPRSRLFKPLILETAEAAAAGYVVGSAERRDLLGKTGVALTTLRPSGRAEIEGESVLVVADGEFIESGTRVVVQKVRGNRVVVRQA